ncbi:hypothetical protein DDB_G0271230 [Dictyostelium discoideum AX4]|uniref:Uncharacterized protein n=1 Tax=Dictyostelium discoideum TaxID=44689 RepID=Q55B95_DICDI|nr:hypothetical protein DDB_G0271230 [Dictyostelium discoideum AX4]EAL71745.1 hypothetical protein DDB_G0271230 [Dictyostelium discoideum AX4]|eukprot:XP_645717.1 hypothetical protein DDB_G0271230 [Dictyostelium discoideum AX4]
MTTTTFFRARVIGTQITIITSNWCITTTSLFRTTISSTSITIIT